MVKFKVKLARSYRKAISDLSKSQDELYKKALEKIGIEDDDEGFAFDYFYNNLDNGKEFEKRLC